MRKNQLLLDAQLSSNQISKVAIFSKVNKCALFFSWSDLVTGKGFCEYSFCEKDFVDLIESQERIISKIRVEVSNDNLKYNLKIPEIYLYTKTGNDVFTINDIEERYLRVVIYKDVVTDGNIKVELMRQEDRSWR